MTETLSKLGGRMTRASDSAHKSIISMLHYVMGRNEYSSLTEALNHLKDATALVQVELRDCRRRHDGEPVWEIEASGE